MPLECLAAASLSRDTPRPEPQDQMDPRAGKYSLINSDPRFPVALLRVWVATPSALDRRREALAAATVPGNCGRRARLIASTPLSGSWNAALAFSEFGQ